MLKSHPINVKVTQIENVEAIMIMSEDTTYLFLYDNGMMEVKVKNRNQIISQPIIV